jgi:hypothetical protein
MKIKIESACDGKELIEDFINKLKSNNIEAPWKEGADLPIGVRIIVKNKNDQEIEISPDKLKIVFNKG